MTTEEIKNQLEDLIRDRESFMVGDYDKDIYDRDKEALKFAVKAVEKQIPKKLNIHEILDESPDCIYKDYLYNCPSCNFCYGEIDEKMFKVRCCPICGQMLDWSGDDEENTDTV